MADNIEPETGAAPAVCGEKAAQHANGGGLAAAVGAEKSADFPFGDLEAETVDDLKGGEALRRSWTSIT